MLLTTEKCFFFMAQVLGFSNVIKSHVKAAVKLLVSFR